MASYLSSYFSNITEGVTMQFSKNELYLLINQPGIRWFVDADLSGANLRGAQLREANLSGADLSQADLRNTNLGGANLTSANLMEAKMTKSYLGGANLNGANLCGADLSDVNLDDGLEQEKTSFKSATYDEFTQWPDGFDPIVAGAIRMPHTS